MCDAIFIDSCIDCGLEREMLWPNAKEDIILVHLMKVSKLRWPYRQHIDGEKKVVDELISFQVV